MTYDEHPLLPQGRDARSEKRSHPSSEEASPEERLKRPNPLGRNPDLVEALPNRPKAISQFRTAAPLPERLAKRAGSASRALPTPTAPARSMRWFARAIAAVFLVGVLLAGAAALVATLHPLAKAPVTAL